MTRGPPNRLVCLAIGASDAAGVGAEPLTNGYVFRIAEELDERIDQVFLVPLAIPGAHTAQLEAALERLLETDIEPGLFALWTGANDVIRGGDADDFEAALENIFEDLREGTDGVVAVAKFPDLTELPRFRGNPDEDVSRERIETFNDAIAEQAADHDALVVDLYSEPVEDDLVSDERTASIPTTRGTAASRRSSSRLSYRRSASRPLREEGRRVTPRPAIQLPAHNSNALS
jgi:lysophospholipase L1-like esterase